MSVTLRNRERTIVRGLVRYLKRTHWLPVRASFGEHTGERAVSESAVLAVFDAADCCVITFMRANEMKQGKVMLVAGNRDDVISDYTGPSAFTVTIDNYLDTL